MTTTSTGSAVVSEAEVEAAARATFELLTAYVSTGPDAELWTWQEASPAIKTDHRDNARAALEAAARVRATASLAQAQTATPTEAGGMGEGERG